MALPSLQQLESAPLSLLVFGPGFGESILIRTPNGSWAAIDSARRQRKASLINPALAALEAYEAHLSLLVLTHPHLDHANGIRDLLERCNHDAVIAAVEPFMRTPSPYAVSIDADDLGADQGGVAIAAHSAIQLAWNDGHPQWEIEAGSTLLLGGCTFEVLTPGPDELQAFRESGSADDFNELSAAIRLRWPDSGDLVLGADAGVSAWAAAQARLAPEDLAACEPVKVPHHGSKYAIHPLLLPAVDPRPSRPMVLTPWSKGEKLPRFEPGEGADQLLGATDALQLTSLPRASVPQTPSISISDVQAALKPEEIDDETGVEPVRIQRDRPSLVDADPDVLAAWVLIQPAEAGGFTVTRGTSALELVR